MNQIIKSYQPLFFPPKPETYTLHQSNERMPHHEWKHHFTHDPHIFKDEASGLYYIYSTDLGNHPGIHIRRSTNLINWEFVGTGLIEGVPKEANEWSNAVGLWAPDIIKVNDEYRIYYSASTFGSQQSCIGLAVAKSPEGPFVHKGIVIKTTLGDPVNAIDANIATDHETNEHYLVYGSFWRGIRIIKLNKETGLALEEGFGVSLASRPLSVEGAVEGAYMAYNEETKYYYLFVSYGSLSSDYNVRVARSKNMTGPFKDFNGIALTKGFDVPNAVGLKITSGYKFNDQVGWKALGHNSVLNDNGQWYLITHARCEDEYQHPYLQIRKIIWSNDGWPLVSPTLYRGEILQDVPVDLIAGQYEIIKFKDLTTDLVENSQPMTLTPNGEVMINGEAGTWESTKRHQFMIHLAGESIEMNMFVAWDFQDEHLKLFMTGLTTHGKCVWAMKNESLDHEML